MKKQLLSSEPVGAIKSQTFRVYNLRTFFRREPGNLERCPSCGSGIISSEVEPSKKVATDMSDINAVPSHYFSRLYLCSACAWWGVRERWGLLVYEEECDYMIAGMAEQKDLAGKRESQPWRLVLENIDYLSALPLPRDWGDLFGSFRYLLNRPL